MGKLAQMCYPATVMVDEDRALIVVSGGDTLLDQATQTYLAGMAPNTRRAYGSRLGAFFKWRAAQEAHTPLVAQLKEYVSYLQESGRGPRSVQAHLNTIKGLLRIAAALEPSLAAGLPQLELVKAPPVRGEVQGRRLTRQQALTLLQAPGDDTVKGLRDSAILGLLLVLGLRRSEICTLTWGHVAELEGHKVIANLKGKHGRVRTLKLPVWLWRLIAAWGEQARLEMNNPSARVFLPMSKGGSVVRARADKGITPHAIYKLVNYYTARLSLPSVKPHDLRRTAALLARRGGASIEQVQLMLGHASPQTTSNYIGESLNLDDNAVDYSPLSL